jgi:Protein of unknown function (DUF1553)/Protein of unknown function (DUF1549)
MRRSLYIFLVAMALAAARAAEPAAPHWAFSPPKPVQPPRAASASRNPVDAFIEDRLAREGLHPSARASKEVLLRRVTFDLTGLPPTPAELDAFLSDNSPRAWEHVVDRLLASPAYGERWAQHWLDLAHYADSNGFELDADRPDAWRYRDWVVDAFNNDMPFDRFALLQIAGDEAAPGDVAAQIASGFCRAGPREVVSGNIDPEVRRQDELTEAVTSMGSVFLGLTVGCARCHDHKFDPLPAADYYGLEAYFAGTRLEDIAIHTEAEEKQHTVATEAIEAKLKPLHEAKARLEEPYRTALHRRKEEALTPAERAIRAKRKEDRTPEEERQYEGTNVALDVKWEEVAEAVAQSPKDWAAREELKRRIYELERQSPRPLAHAMAMAETSDPIPDTWLLRRGNIKDKRSKVEPHLPAALTGSAAAAFLPPSKPIDNNHSGRRLSLARWVASPDNPLTARVIVNRVWQHHFGRGLVATSSDFGVRGERPTHPELLDWLAGELVRQGWRLKPLHRLIVMSDAYRRTSDPAGNEARLNDPDNRLLWRMNRRRLEAEELRDALLAVSGRLNLERGGPGVPVELEREVSALIFSEQEVVELWPVHPDPAQRVRRSVYVYRKRNVHYPMFDAFDAPDALTPCPVRPVSTHAPQALVMMNGGFAIDCARAFARGLLASDRSPDARIREAFRRSHTRTPSASETAGARALAGDKPEGWVDLALALINANDFAYVP